MLSKSNKDRNLKDHIAEWLSKNNLQKKFEQKTIHQFWEDVVGTLVASKTTKIHFSSGILTVNVETSVFRNEIILHKVPIILELNKKLKKHIVEDIKVY